MEIAGIGGEMGNRMMNLEEIFNVESHSIIMKAMQTSRELVDLRR